MLDKRTDRLQVAYVFALQNPRRIAESNQLSLSIHHICVTGLANLDLID